ncbi:MAG TPA: F0F1 ATP synthase subunit A [Dehalococcoidia bacterium]|nr:F0F1 ATP synthase subunit A [Dehalococcoidia bacterium]
MRIWLIAIGVIALIGGGMVFVPGPAPVVIVAPEHVFDFPVLGFGVTNTMFTSWFVVALIVVGGIVVGRNVSLVPSGFSGAIEAVLTGFYETFVVGVVGEEKGRRFFPLVATIFFFIVISNYVGLLPMNNIVGVPEPNHGDKQVVFEQTTFAGLDLAVIPIGPTELDLGTGDHAVTTDEHEKGQFSGLLAPYFRSVMTDVNAPLAIALFSFVFVEFWGFQALGFGYLKKFFNFSRLLKGNPMGLIDVFVGLLEVISELARVVSFTFRLFGNIFAGEVLLLMMGFLVPFVLVDIFYGLELFVGLVQAFVFAMLTLVFAQTATTSHDDHDDHGAASSEAAPATSEGTTG